MQNKVCGLVGILGHEACGDFFAAMLDTLAHRGPDDTGVWVDVESAIALGHKRLSVLDVSPNGHQPMASRSGRYVIAYNGEIYNHVELREELQSRDWRGHSDTETFLECVEEWGLEKTLQRCVGMFAFALWDRDKRVLFIARDRLGEKPLYYGWVRGAFVFASELKAIRAFPGFDNAVDRRALSLFMRHNCVPAPWSIYENIWKLPPGTWASFPARRLMLASCGSPQAYWSAKESAIQGIKNPFTGSDAEAVEELERVLCQSIAGQMIADVPLGAFLSGGIDSSTVVGIMQSLSSRPVQTFTVGFEENSFDESAHALAVAKYLGTEHTELRVTSSEAQSVIPRLSQIYDEPFADSSQIPTFLIAELARRHVVVALSGDGGDELFGGYNRHLWGERLSRLGQCCPLPLRRFVASGLTSFSPDKWNNLFSVLAPLLPASYRFSLLGDKIHKLAGAMCAANPARLYLNFVSHWENPAELVIGAVEPLTPVTDPDAWLDCPGYFQQMMYLDLITYLPDDILVKIDRAAMAVSLETRVPLLDHRVVEFAWSLPQDMKIRNGQGKWALRQVLDKYVPRKLVERPKMGFGVPLDAWLRGPLREWAEELLGERRLRDEGFFEPKLIRRKWMEHLSKRRNWSYLLWDVLMYQSWLDSIREPFKDNDA